MKILKPSHNKVSVKVKKWKNIKEEALALRDLIKNGEFEGQYKQAFAISHAQVSESPYNFFVLNDQIEEGKLLKEFGSWCIINLEITDSRYPIFWKEACMSFPFRDPRNVSRSGEVEVTYQVLSWKGMSRKVKKLIGMPAFISQHEFDHSRGKNIYGIGTKN